MSATPTAPQASRAPPPRAHSRTRQTTIRSPVSPAPSAELLIAHRHVRQSMISTQDKNERSVKYEYGNSTAVLRRGETTHAGVKMAGSCSGESESCSLLQIGEPAWLWRSVRSDRKVRSLTICLIKTRLYRTRQAKNRMQKFHEHPDRPTCAGESVSRRTRLPPQNVDIVVQPPLPDMLLMLLSRPSLFMASPRRATTRFTTATVGAPGDPCLPGLERSADTFFPPTTAFVSRST